MRSEFERALSCWRRYLDAEPWRRIDSDAIFRVDDDKSGEIYYASILGRQGTLYGLALNRGEEGLRILGGVIQQDVDHDQAFTTVTSICISRQDGPVPRWYRDFLQESLGRKKGIRGLPLLYVNEGSRGPRPPNVEEVHLLAAALDVIAALVGNGTLNPPVFEPGRPMLCIHLRSDGSHGISEKTPEFQLPQVERYHMPPDRRDAIRELPRLDGTDLVSCAVAPALVQGRKVRTLGVVDPESDLIFAGECLELDDQEGIARCLLSIYEGRNTGGRIGVPREIQTDSRYFYEAFKDALGEIGIRVICFEQIPALERIRRSFADFFSRRGGSGGADRR
jgi:hypothetical protein